LNELVKPEYEGRLFLSEGNYLAGEYIIDQLKEYGLESIDGEDYSQEFKYRDALLPVFPSYPNMPFLTLPLEEGTIKLTSNDGEVSIYNVHDDFMVAVLGYGLLKDVEVIGEEISRTGISVNKKNADELSGKDKGSSIALVENVNGIQEIAPRLVRGQFHHPIYFWIVEEDQQRPFPTYGINTNSIAIVPRGELAKKISSDQYEVEIKIRQSKPKSDGYRGRNILAVLPGKDWDQPDDIKNKKKKDIIIVGSIYDGLGMMDDRVGAMRASRAAINLEIARVISQLEEPLDKTIVFAFWDGDSLLSSSGSYYAAERARIFSTQDYNITYLDVGFASNQKRINLDIATSTLGDLQVNTYNITQEINKRLKKQNIPYGYTNSTSRSFTTFGMNLSLKVSAGSGQTTLMDTKKDTIENINKKQMKNIGQFFIDLITVDENIKSTEEIR